MLKAFGIANRMKGTLSFSSECVETKFCRPCTSFTSPLHGLCGRVWFLRVKKRRDGVQSTKLLMPTEQIIVPLYAHQHCGALMLNNKNYQITIFF